MFDNQDTSTIKNNLIIDFPYLNYQFGKNIAVKEILLLHLFPYILSAYQLENIKSYQAPVSLMTMNMILADETEKTQKKFITNALNDIKTKTKTSCYFAYKLEYDEFQRVGGYESILYNKNWASLEQEIKDNAESFFTIHAIVRHLLRNYSPNNKNSYSYVQAFRDVKSANDKYSQLILLGSKKIEEEFWAKFKYVAPIIYGYIEALYVKHQIPEIPERIKNISDKQLYRTELRKYINTELGAILANTKQNAKFMDDIIGYALYAQQIFPQIKHRNNSHDFYKILLPEDKLKQNYRFKAKK